jgi:hypothetical protein
MVAGGMPGPICIWFILRPTRRQAKRRPPVEGSAAVAEIIPNETGSKNYAGR